MPAWCAIVQFGVPDGYSVAIVQFGVSVLYQYLHDLWEEMKATYLPAVTMIIIVQYMHSAYIYTYMYVYVHTVHVHVHLMCAHGQLRCIQRIHNQYGKGLAHWPTSGGLPVLWLVVFGVVLHMDCSIVTLTIQSWTRTGETVIDDNSVLLGSTLVS